MIKVGLTGGIGSGKTYVSTVFNSLGIPIFNADEFGKKAYTDPYIKKQVITLFGERSFTDLGIDRNYIAEKVFNSKNLLEKLNHIIHPWVAKEFDIWTDNMSDKAYIIKEAAILFESGANVALDKMICVHAPDNVRLNRVLTRDGGKSEDILSRMKNQWPQEEKMKMSDYLLNNDGINLVTPQVLNIHNRIIKQ